MIFKSREKLIEEYSKFNFGILIGFKSIFFAIKIVDEGASEINEKHPREELSLLWFDIMLVFYILMFGSYQAFWAVTGFFYIPYTFDLFILAASWKRFGYSLVEFWIKSVATLLVGAFIMILVHFFLF